MQSFSISSGADLGITRWSALPWRRSFVLAVLFVGICLSALVSYLLRSIEFDKAKSAFHSAAADRFDDLQSDLQFSVVRVNALGAFCASSYPVTRTSFDTFTSPLISGPDAAIQALEWVPQVSLSERAKVEKSARAAGFPEFEIRDRLEQGRMVRSGDRAEYFPVLWVQPYKGNEPALGFDMASDLIRREALMRAEAVAQPTASKRITLVQETGKQYGILILQPVYGRASGASGRQLLGFALGVLRISSIVEKHGAHSGIDLTLTDMDANAAEQRLYPSDGRSPQPVSDFTQRSTITVGGRTWMLTASPSPGAFPVVRTYSYQGFVLCLLITLLLVAYLWNSLHRHMQVERLVEERTAALNNAMTLLEEVDRDLEDSEARYRRLVECSPNAIVVERGGEIVLVNRNTVEMFGFDAANDSVAHGLLEFVAPDRRPYAAALVERLYKEDLQVPPLETRLLRRDGSIMDAEIAASSYMHAGQRSIQVTLRDISQRKLAEAENARLIRAIEQADESIVITDVDANIVYVNPAFERISGYSREEAIGKNPRVLKSGRQPAEFYTALWERLSAGESWTGRFVNRMKSGRLYSEEATISPVVNRSGEIINYVAVKRDVTRELELQDQLLQSRKMDAVGRLAGGVAHDFNNMLMVIISYAELLASDLAEDDPRRKHTAQILHAAERSSALTRQLLAFSRKQVFAPRVLDCNSILTETSSMVRRLIGENIELTCDLASELWMVKADSDQLVQMILNLCVNSRDAMPDGGELTISSRNFRLNEGYVEISVSDTGTGILPEVREKLFEPFFTTKEIGKGTGLGLATVYGIVEQSGGHIRVESVPGQGATFRVYLPRCSGPEGAGDQPAAAPAIAGSSLVLVVEDEETLRDAICKQLQGNGFRVLSATDGLEAMEVLEQHVDVALLITDLVMPRMGGRELVRLASRAMPQLRILVLSGYADQSLSSEDCNGCPIEFLQKPFSLRTLFSRIAALNRRSPVVSQI
jgi:PAS domain S-box-containing protein